jgi:RecA-family ATPase
MKHLKLQAFCGETLRTNSTPPETIVENFVWKEDVAMWLGSEKAGKSIGAQQLAMSIVTGRPFLDKFKVEKPGPVVYIQAEGKRDEFVDRLNNICMSMEGFVDSKFLHIFKKFMPLNHEPVRQAVFDLIDAQILVWGEPPVAIIIDSVYKAMDGDLNDNSDVIAFTNALDEFISRYHASIILIHHDSKEWRDDKTKGEIERGDKGSYGSVFLRAYVDHIFYLKKMKDKTRMLSCDTTRSSKTSEERLSLILVEPAPLCFQIKGDYTPSAEMILHQIKLHQCVSYKELMEFTGLALITLKQSMNILIKDKKVVYEDIGKERAFTLRASKAPDAVKS